MSMVFTNRWKVLITIVGLLCLLALLAIGMLVLHGQPLSHQATIHSGSVAAICRLGCR